MAQSKSTSPEGTQIGGPQDQREGAQGALPERSVTDETEEEAVSKAKAKDIMICALMTAARKKKEMKMRTMKMRTMKTKKSKQLWGLGAITQEGHEEFKGCFMKVAYDVLPWAIQPVKDHRMKLMQFPVNVLPMSQQPIMRWNINRHTHERKKVGSSHELPQASPSPKVNSQAHEVEKGGPLRGFKKSAQVPTKEKSAVTGKRC
ncbi:hypothetical protein BS47DRAFT_1370037 [Hydnum rufescens UP504]|uniref:Uncharacterized protein n=1 Tax=Hydnum rufescens UP504 TaxID=1448309 RepID=A0A9P6AC98_9AGAM|nr:hypothetical protein BS47DRAFT_1370037 [Hydnum rufescens UP504]